MGMTQNFRTREAYVALLRYARGSQTGTFRLYMTNPAAGIALLGGGRPRLRARSRLVSWLTAVVAEPLLRRTILRDVSNCDGVYSSDPTSRRQETRHTVTALKTTLPAELICHPDQSTTQRLRT